MKKVSLYFLACLLVLQLAGCRGGSAENYSVDVGQTIKIELESNWSTGYQWHLTNEDEMKYISKTGFNYGPDQAADDELDGAPGIERWIFTGDVRGTETLKFEYKRAPDDKKPAERKKIAITVK